MKTSKSIRKIKISEKGVEIHHIVHHMTKDEKVYNTQIPLKTQIPPHKDLLNKFLDMKRHAINILELAPFSNPIDQAILEKHVVTTINISESDDDTQIMISINRYLKSGKCTSITTPLISLEHEDYALLEELNNDYESLIQEVREYLNGKNGEGQLELSFELKVAV